MILAMEAEGLKDQKIGMSGLIVDSVYSLSKEAGAGGGLPMNRRTLIQKAHFSESSEMADCLQRSKPRPVLNLLGQMLC